MADHKRPHDEKRKAAVAEYQRERFIPRSFINHLDIYNGLITKKDLGNYSLIKIVKAYGVLVGYIGVYTEESGITGTRYAVRSCKPKTGSYFVLGEDAFLVPQTDTTNRVLRFTELPEMFKEKACRLTSSGSIGISYRRDFILKAVEEFKRRTFDWPYLSSHKESDNWERKS